MLVQCDLVLDIILKYLLSGADGVPVQQSQAKQYSLMSWH